MRSRRTTRHFFAESVPREAIEWAIRVAGAAPSGAHQQPWTFVAVSDSDVKQRIRDAAERAENEFYHGRAPDEWLEALAPLGTDEHKAHLTDAPWVVVLFRQTHGLRPDGSKRTHYYSQESCGIAAGFIIAAVHIDGARDLDAYAESHGLSRRAAPAAGAREGHAGDACWLSRFGRARA